MPATRSARQESGWALISGLALAGALLSLGWLLTPAARCAWRQAEAVDAPNIVAGGAEVAVEQARAGQDGRGQRPVSGGDRVARFTDAAAACYTHHPFASAPLFRQQLVSGLAALWLASLLISRLSSKGPRS